MNKAFLFVIMLVSVSFVGCIEDSSEELSSEDTTSENTQEDEGLLLLLELIMPQIWLHMSQQESG